MIPRPPAHVQPYVDALGPEVAVRFFLRFGGTDFYVPRDPKGGSDMAEVLGMPAARALSALAQRTVLPRRVPIPKPWIARYLKFTAGVTRAEICRILHASDTAVGRWLAGVEPGFLPDDPQLTLF